ncbi:MAG: nucleotidyl transferase AbiEii/AbiGii toxin family protein [Bdellovibrionales bacterium]|nr:nucleotidyl transferase AbiEii/AbiGii toxin family protein [Bdellovibrionales bacterium]
MNQIHRLPAERRRLFFAEAETETGIPFPIVEKDYWVVWTLDRLFSIPELKTHLTFKGGTSLSKVYRVISRFSEDIDVSIEKDFLGFTHEKDPEKAASKKKTRAAVEALAAACAKYVRNELRTLLRASIASEMGTDQGWDLVIDPKDPDDQTLLFEYPNLTPKGGYIQQAVKIEMGAMSEHWPVSEHPIQSYAKEALPDKVTEPAVRVRVLNAERTFWEKATILHQYAHLPETKALPDRISRHYYDFYQLLNSDIKVRALADVALLERVAVHKGIYFASGWANYETARKGTLVLSPLPRLLEGLENDFQQMNQMFFGKIPDWQLILRTIQQFEAEFNS